MGTEIVKQDEMSIVEQVVVSGDLARLTPEQRVIYYRQVCESTGLNPFTKPFDYIILNGKLTLYANKGASDQIRSLRGISISSIETTEREGLLIVRARATTQDGRTDESTAAVSVSGLRGLELANAIMKAETKAKRRVTLSIAGLGFLDTGEGDDAPIEDPRDLISTKHVQYEDDGDVVWATSDKRKPAPVQSEEVEATYTIHATPTPKASGNVPVTPVTEAVPIDMDKARKAFHAQGVSVFGKDWENARHWFIARYTRKMTPQDVRESANELTGQELQTLRLTLVDRGDFYLAEYAKEFSERHEAAGEAAAAGMAGPELNPNPFETAA